VSTNSTIRAYKGSLAYYKEKVKSAFSKTRLVLEKLWKNRPKGRFFC